MKLASFTTLSLLACLIKPIGTTDARAAQLTFSLYVMGFPVAESNMTVNLAPSAYAMTLRYRTTGLASAVAGGLLDQSSNGAFEHGQPVPREFRSFIRLHSQDRTVTLTYRNGNPAITAIDPVNESEREIVPVALREHTLDPLSAMVDVLHAAAQSGRCDLSHTTYDGRRLELFEARTVDDEDVPPSSRSIFSGHALRCDYSSTPMAGLRRDEGHDADARVRKGTVWLAQVVPGGPRVPVQGIVDIRFLGSATMYLTEAAP